MCIKTPVNIDRILAVNFGNISLRFFYNKWALETNVTSITFVTNFTVFVSILFCLFFFSYGWVPNNSDATVVVFALKCENSFTYVHHISSNMPWNILPRLEYMKHNTLQLHRLCFHVILFIRRPLSKTSPLSPVWIYWINSSVILHLQTDLYISWSGQVMICTYF